MNESHTTMSVAELATTRPTSIPVLHRHGIDFCCGGNSSIQDACAAHGISPADLLSEIEQAELRLENPTIDWSERPLVELLHHILTRYHEPERDALDRLQDLAERVAEAHGGREDFPAAELLDEVGTLRDDLLSHMGKEEQILFPWIASGRGAQAGGPVTVMMRDHDDTARALGRIRKFTTDFAAPEWACGTVRALYAQLAAFDGDIREHIHLENNILFPRALRGDN